ncbi:mitochondrial carrier domain-containing protein [Xylaria nigripes]|nr:mitochondrial carrier domain-containing protein [Xylaria nigripes]
MAINITIDATAIRAIHEGWRSLYRGLVPSLSGVVPTTATQFYAYGDMKHPGARFLGRDEKHPLVHAQAATAASPIWVVTTRLIRKPIFRQEGMGGLYKGLGETYLGVSETVTHFPGPNEPSKKPGNLTTAASAADYAKLAAVLVTYPHKVVRTWLHQAPLYTGIFQCFRRVCQQEGWRDLYAGLTPHLMRSFPSAAISRGVYEFVQQLLA